MLKYLTVITALIFSPAWAADAEKLTVEQVLQINLALSQMNCGNKIIKDGGKESFVCEPYKWSTGLSWQIAGNQHKVLDTAAQYNKLRNQVIASLARKPDGEPTSEAAAKFAIQDREFQEQKVDIALDHFRRSDLEPMNLPPAVLSALWPIID
jgi:hypothetical protein